MEIKKQTQTKQIKPNKAKAKPQYRTVLQYTDNAACKIINNYTYRIFPKIIHVNPSGWTTSANIVNRASAVNAGGGHA